MTGKVVLFPDEIAGEIQTNWGGAAQGSYREWTRTVLTYNVLAEPYGILGEITGIVRMSSEQLAATVKAFAMWQELVGLTLLGVESLDADISVARSSNTTNDGTYATPNLGGRIDKPFDTPAFYSIDSQEIWLASDWDSLNDPTQLLPNGYGFVILLHEIAHTLGLSHSGPYNATDNPPPTYLNDATFVQDTRQYTIMSYFGGFNTTTGQWNTDGGNLYSATPQIYDILAMQSKYGANYSTRSGDTRYGDLTNADWNFFEFNDNDNPLFTIWDGGGHDTLDDHLSLKSDTLDLTPGSYSSVKGLRENIGIAFGAIIEDAVSGIGDDSLQGNAADNRLDGGVGSDLNAITPGDGNDTLAGGDGNDTLLGGNGDNQLFGDKGDDSLVGAGGSDYARGGDGNDTIAVGEGRNDVSGGAGNDSISVGHGDNEINGGAGNDTITAGNGGNLVGGGDGDDSITTGSGDDTILAGQGADTLDAGAGQDSLEGGTDNDLLVGGGGADTFGFAPGDGQDWVLDFTPGSDVVDLRASTHIHYFNALLANAQPVDVNLRITLSADATDRLSLLGVETAQLTPRDFMFAEAGDAGGDFIVLGDGIWPHYQTIASRPVALAALAGGAFVVVGEDRFSPAGDDGIGPGLYARIYRADGSLQATVTVDQDPGGWQFAPSVATLANGQFVVAWLAAASAPVPTAPASMLLSGVSVQARILNADGTPAGAQFAVSPADARFSADHDLNNYADGLGDPTVAALANGGFAISWKAAPLPGDPALFGNRIEQLTYDAAGQPLDAQMQRISTLPDNLAQRIYDPAGDQWQDQQALLLANGDRVLAWSTAEAYTLDGTKVVSQALHWRLFHPDGSAEPEGYRAVEGATQPRLTQLSTGQVLLTCLGQNGLVVEALTGSWAGPTTVDLTGAFGIHYAITALPNGEAALFWVSQGVHADGAGTAIRGAILHADGMLGDSFILNALDATDPGQPAFASGADQGMPNAVTLADGRVVVTWTDAGTDLRAVILDSALLGRTIGGTEAADTLVGSGYDDHIFGRGGDDMLHGRGGGDAFDGGDGRDTVNYEMSLLGVVASLTTGTGSAGHALGDSFISIENLAGSAYDDSLTGDADDNLLAGDFGNDSLDGGAAGKDTLYGNAGNDTLALRDQGEAQGDAGNDSVSASGTSQALLGGGLGDDTLSAFQASGGSIEGGDGADSISVAQSDGIVVWAGDGDDSLHLVGLTNGLVHGDAGQDSFTLEGGSDDQLFGGEGNDQLGVIAAALRVQVHGEGGDDEVVALSGTDIALYGDGGNDHVTTHASGGSSLYGGAGNDTLAGADGNDLLRDDDSGFAVGDDSLAGGGGNDTLYSHGGLDTLDGGAGDNLAIIDRSGALLALTLLAGGATLGDGTRLNNITHVVIIGGQGGDTLGTGDADGTLYGGVGSDSLVGGLGADALYDHRQDLGPASNTSNDTLLGGAGNDTLGTGGGGDSLDGGEGHDVLRVDARGLGAPFSLMSSAGGATLFWGSIVQAHVANVEDFDLALGNQRGFIDLRAVAGNDTVRGGDGADTVFGGVGADQLQGGAANDQLDGGGGRDVVLFSGNRADTELLHNQDGSWTAGGPDGTDTLRHVEVARFADGEVLLAGPHHRDFDGSGGDDILWLSDSGMQWAWALDGFNIANQGGHQVNDPGWHVAGTGDFNGDGLADIFWRNDSGANYLWLMNGIAIQPGTGPVDSVATAWSVAGIADLTGDGRDDILWWHAATGSLWLFGMEGGSINPTTSGAVMAAGGAWVPVKLGDLDGDGLGDILWQNASSGEFYAWRMQGTSVLGMASLGVEGAVPGVTDWAAAGVADFNRDGREDVLLRSASTGELRLWQMHADLSHDDLALDNPGTAWSIVALGDYNADGMADLLWRHTATGEVYLWTMNGNAIADQHSFGNPGNNWQVVA